jgi:hypothetical protein
MDRGFQVYLRICWNIQQQFLENSEWEQNKSTPLREVGHDEG